MKKPAKPSLFHRLTINLLSALKLEKTVNLFIKLLFLGMSGKSGRNKRAAKAKKKRRPWRFGRSLLLVLPLLPVSDWYSIAGNHWKGEFLNNRFSKIHSRTFPATTYLLCAECG